MTTKIIALVLLSIFAGAFAVTKSKKGNTNTEDLLVWITAAFLFSCLSIGIYLLLFV